MVIVFAVEVKVAPDGDAVPERLISAVNGEPDARLAGIRKDTCRVAPITVVTAVAAVVTALPFPADGVSVTVTAAGVIVPAGNLEPVTVTLVTSG